MASPLPPGTLISDAADVNVAWGGIGQYTDTVNPCRYMTFMGQIAGGGTAAEPYLVSSASSGIFSRYTARTQQTDRVMPTAVYATGNDALQRDQ